MRLLFTALAFFICSGIFGQNSINNVYIKNRHNLSEFIKEQVEADLKKWLKKGEFEKQSDYTLRIKSQSIDEKTSSIENRILNRVKIHAVNALKESYDPIIHFYDSENETFLIEIRSFGEIIVPVPINEAEIFKDFFEMLEIGEVKFIYFENRLVISRFEFIDDMLGKSYVFDVSNKLSYDRLDISYDIEDELVNTYKVQNEKINYNTTVNSEHLKKYSEIKFQISDSTFSINSIAVIPKEIKECNGNVSSADELASFTETNILSHYNVTDRRHLEAILEEQRLQMTGLTFEKTLIEFGCIENAQAYLFVQSGCLMGDEMIEIRLVHCETSNLVWSCTGINASPQEVLARINEELSKE